MSTSESIYIIIEHNNCPFYRTGDTFRLSGNALPIEYDNEQEFITTAIVNVPKHQPACRTLISDLTRMLIRHENIEKIPEKEIDCSGCKGSVRLRPMATTPQDTGAKPGRQCKDINAIADLLRHFSIFETLTDHHRKEFISFLGLRRFPKNEYIINRGDQGKNLFIILSGKVEVLNDEGGNISTLKKGDVFGEMSLLSGDPVGASVKAAAATTVLFINGRDFITVLNKSASLQMYFTRLLAKRLAESNALRSKEIASGMSGKLRDIPPSELFQILNISQKTGVLTLTLSKGKAVLSFREGSLVRVKYSEKENTEAFFDILKEKDGRFKFLPGLPPDEMNAPAIGYLMGLLMEGLRRIDEGKA